MRWLLVFLGLITLALAVKLAGEQLWWIAIPDGAFGAGVAWIAWASLHPPRGLETREHEESAAPSAYSAPLSTGAAVPPRAATPAASPAFRPAPRSSPQPAVFVPPTVVLAPPAPAAGPPREKAGEKKPPHRAARGKARGRRHKRYS